MPTIEERAQEMASGHGSFYAALCHKIKAIDAERAAHVAFRQGVSDAARDAVAMLDEMAKPLLMDHNVKERLEKARSVLAPLIIAKPDPLIYLAREMVLLDGVIRTDSQKAAIREGRAANTAADDFYDRLRTALPARGLKLVEVGDAD